MAWTLADIREKVIQDMNLQDEDFVETDEFTGYVNEAIREAEAEIHKLGIEDNYFRSSIPLVLAEGVGVIDMPTNIYADKILNIQYKKSDRRYEITRFRGKNKYADFQYYRDYGTMTTYYQYLLTNNDGTGPKIEISPLAYETGTFGTIWFIRNAKELVLETDVCDIPEFINFILQYVKDQCINKERQTPDAPPSPKLSQQRQLMIDTLNEQVPDGNNTVEQDFTHYEESI